MDQVAGGQAVMVGARRGGEPSCRCASDEDESRVLYEETLDCGVLAAQRRLPPCGQVQKHSRRDNTARRTLSRREFDCFPHHQ